ADCRDRFRPVRCRSHDRDRGIARQEILDSLASQKLVVGDHDPQGLRFSHEAVRNGRIISAMAPPSARDVRVNDAASPYNSARRARVLARPTPLSAAGSTPGPLLETVMTRSSWRRRAVISTIP